VLAQDFLYGDPMNVMTLIDNHDMPRAAYLAEGNTDRLEHVLTMLFTLRGIPQIPYGTETGVIGGTSHVELHADDPGGCPGGERSAFTAEGRTGAENRVYNTTRDLLHLRQRQSAAGEPSRRTEPPRRARSACRFAYRCAARRTAFACCRQKEMTGGLVS